MKVRTRRLNSALVSTRLYAAAYGEGETGDPPVSVTGNIGKVTLGVKGSTQRIAQNA
jgi:hypothetical protein